MKKIFADADMEHLFASRDSLCSKSLVQSLKEKLVADHNAVWLQTIDNMPKLRTYKLFKRTVGKESYLDLPPQYRKTLAQFRAGVFPLELERGRWRGKPVEERICRQCTMLAVESEYHYLVECTKYNDLRLKLAEDCNIDINTHDDPQTILNILFKDSNQYHISKFIIESFLTRNI